MIKIGIIGIPGSGKTTLSRYLTTKKEEITYLSVDEITEADEGLLQLRDGYFVALHNNELPEEKLKNMKATLDELVRNKITEKLVQFEKDGKKVVVIDYAMLDHIEQIWSDCQYKVLVKRKNEDRKKGLTEREGDRRANILESFCTILKEEQGSVDVDFVITNNGEKTDLFEQGDDVLDQIKLQEKSKTKRHYSYYVIRPDGIRFFKEICSSLEERFNNVDSIRFFKINDYGSTMRKLYYKNFEELPELFGKFLDTHIKSMKSLYGNEGILVVMSEVHKTEEEYNDFMQRVFKTKQFLRNKLMDPDIRLATKLQGEGLLKNKSSIAEMDGQEFELNLDKTLSRIHCPDDDEESTTGELKILLDSGILSNENMLGAVDIQNVIKYGSIKGFNQDSEEQRPDIAGFEKKRIEESLEK